MKAFLILLASASCLFGQAGVFGNNPNLRYGLVGWWTMNDGTGTVVNDYSGYANKGNMTNALTWTNGIVSSCLQWPLTPVVANFIITTYTNSLGNTLSWSAWALNFGTTSTDYRTIMSMGYKSTTTPTAPYISFNMAVVPSTKQYGVSIGFTDNTSVTALTTNANAINVWWFIVGTYDGASLKMYTNGVLAASTAASKTIGYDSEKFGIGQYIPNVTHGAAANVTQWTGLIDDVRLYNRVLTATEVKQLYGSRYGSQ